MLAVDVRKKHHVPEQKQMGAHTRNNEDHRRETDAQARQQRRACSLYRQQPISHRYWNLAGVGRARKRQGSGDMLNSAKRGVARRASNATHQ